MNEKTKKAALFVCTALSLGSILGLAMILEKDAPEKDSPEFLIIESADPDMLWMKFSDGVICVVPLAREPGEESKAKCWKPEQ